MASMPPLFPPATNPEDGRFRGSHSLVVPVTLTASFKTISSYHPLHYHTVGLVSSPYSLTIRVDDFLHSRLRIIEESKHEHLHPDITLGAYCVESFSKRANIPLKSCRSATFGARDAAYPYTRVWLRSRHYTLGGVL